MLLALFLSVFFVISAVHCADDTLGFGVKTWAQCYFRGQWHGATCLDFCLKRYPDATGGDAMPEDGCCCKGP
ncbi:unnamed protein product [Microthlaspi erraticum]|uniref:Knottin scorpion toxin-like domain-containing protein n=1 Tax=Microthlaspi erraticum TaxID=1685480 RepID=A0A6D2IVR1_9BRAS|nr:unnamed protein product [Microthlaspi erraticum]